MAVFLDPAVSFQVKGSFAANIPITPDGSARQNTIFGQNGEPIHSSVTTNFRGQPDASFNRYLTGHAIELVKHKDGHVITVVYPREYNYPERQDLAIAKQSLLASIADSPFGETLSSLAAVTFGYGRFADPEVACGSDSSFTLPSRLSNPDSKGAIHFTLDPVSRLPSVFSVPFGPDSTPNDNFRAALDLECSLIGLEKEMHFTGAKKTIGLQLSHLSRLGFTFSDMVHNVDPASDIGQAIGLSPFRSRVMAHKLDTLPHHLPSDMDRAAKDAIFANHLTADLIRLQFAGTVREQRIAARLLEGFEADLSTWTAFDAQHRSHEPSFEPSMG